MDEKKLATIVSAAKTLFAESEFTSAAVPDALEASRYTVGDGIPVVTEWTHGTGDVLVFNKLDSCVGLIGIDGDGKLFGVHLSGYNAYFLAKGKSDFETDVIDLFADVDSKTHFGDNEAAEHWPPKLGDLSGHGFAKLASDASQKCWVFWIEKGAIRAKPF